MNTLTIIFLLSLVIAVHCYGNNGQCLMNAALRQKFVDAHNQLRQKVASGQQSPHPASANIAAISWSLQLEQWASNWAGTCPTGHRSFPSGSNIGENIYWSWTPQLPVLTSYPVEQAVQSWFNEVSAFSVSQISPFQFTSATGHYSQVVWATTTQIGCGVALCYDQSKPSYPNAINIVCNYGPAGNMLGSSMYKTGALSCPNNIVNALYPSLCGNIDTSAINQPTVSTCPPAPANTAPANTAPANTAPANTAPANTAPANTAPATTPAAPAPVLTTFQLGWVMQNPATWLLANPTHPAVPIAQNIAIQATGNYWGDKWTVKSTAAIVTNNVGGNTIQFVFVMTNSAGETKQFIATTKQSGSQWYYSNWSASCFLSTQDELAARVKAGGL